MSLKRTELYAGKVLRLCREEHTLPNRRIDDARIPLPLLLYRQMTGDQR